MLTREHIGIALMVIAVTGLICTIAWWLLAAEDTDTGTFWQRVWFYMTADDAAFHLEASGRHAAARHVAPAGAGLGNPPARGHTHLPEPANPSATRGPGQADDLTEPTLDQVTDWFEQIREPDYDAPPPPRFVRTAPIAPGVYVPLTDDTATDLPRFNPAADGVRRDPEPGQPYHPHAGPPAWQPATPPPAWHWNGHTWLRQAPTGLAWLDTLCTQPLQPALEAAA